MYTKISPKISTQSKKLSVQELKEEGLEVIALEDLDSICGGTSMSDVQVVDIIEMLKNPTKKALGG